MYNARENEFLPAASLSAVAPKRRVSLACFDAITVPGAQCMLSSRITRRHLVLRSRFNGEPVEFFVDGCKAGEAAVEQGGNIRLPCRIERPGRYELTVRFADRSRYSGEAAAGVYCSDKRKPAMIVDIDHTIADDSWIGFFLYSNSLIKPLDNAPEVLGELRSRYDIIFLTRREDHFLGKTRQWLSMYGFPSAPVFYWNILSDPLGAARYKTELIMKLRRAWDNISVGIGDKESDRVAYLRNSLRVIIVGKRRDGVAMPGVDYLPGWKEIRGALIG